MRVEDLSNINPKTLLLRSIFNFLFLKFFESSKICIISFVDNNIFYYHGREAALDILDYRMIKLKKVDNSIKELIDHYINSELPKMPVSADLLMKKYEISEGRQLGEKLKMIEEEWVKNDFEISDQQVDNLVNS